MNEKINVRRREGCGGIMERVGILKLTFGCIPNSVSSGVICSKSHKFS